MKTAPPPLAEALDRVYTPGVPDRERLAAVAEVMLALAEKIGEANSGHDPKIDEFATILPDEVRLMHAYLRAG